MRRYAEPKDAQLKRARDDIEEVAKECDRPWFERLLHILEQGRYATVITTDGRPVDVQAVAFTLEYASFFDILNHALYFNTDILPTEVESLSNTCDSAFRPLPPKRAYSERLTKSSKKAHVFRHGMNWTRKKLHS